MFGQLWSTTSDAADFVAGERQGIAYVRPLTRLLAALVDAQAAAARRAAVDVAAVRAAVDDVTRVDDQHGDGLGVRQRWSAARAEIETTLAGKAAGDDAQRSYAGPIGLIQALVGDLGGQTRIVRDPGVDIYHLVDAALFRLPEVIVNAGRVAALGPAARHGQATARSEIELAQDRISRATETISAGLRMSADSARGEAIDLDLLLPLDEFSASVDALVRTSAALPTSDSALAELSAAHRRVHRATIALDSAVLASLDSLLDDRGDHLAGQRRNTLLAGLAAVFAAAALLWSARPSRTGGGAGAPSAGEATSSPDGSPAHGRADPGDPAADLISARDLHELAQVGPGRARRRREHDDPR